MSNETNFKNINVTDSINLYSLNDNPRKVNLLSREIPAVNDQNDHPGAELNIKTYDANNNPYYCWYLSDYGNFGRYVWDSTTSTWTDSAGIANATDYYVLKDYQATSNANKVMATPNGAAGKPGWRALVGDDLPVVPTTKGGTGQNVTTTNDLLRALGLAKTAGDTVTLAGYIVNGYLTDAKRQVSISIKLPFKFYSVSSASLSGTVYIWQNGIYLYGSSAGKALSSLTVSTGVYTNGRINVNIRGTADSSALNNDVVSVNFSSVTITLS